MGANQLYERTPNIGTAIYMLGIVCGTGSTTITCFYDGTSKTIKFKAAAYIPAEVKAIGIYFGRY